MNVLKSLVLPCSLFLLLGCQAGEDQTNIELIQDMMDGPQIKTQEGTKEGESLMRTPPKGAIARGYKPYPFKKDDISSADTLKSPKASLSKEQLKAFSEVGKRKFEVYCGICHGLAGKGDGNIASKMLKAPPSLVQNVYKSYSDGRLFNVVTNGWGLMGGYVGQVPDELERWAIVDYVRKLQAKAK